MPDSAPSPQGSPPLSAIVTAYLDDLSTRTSAGHVQRCRFALDRILREVGDGLAETLSPAPIVAYRAKRLREGIARATINKELTTLQAALAWAVEAEMLSASPIKSLRALPVREADVRRAKRALSEEEVVRLLEAARARDRERTRRGIRQYPLWLALIDTGARRGETLALRWCDIDLDGAAVTFRAETTKAGRARTVPIDAGLVEELQRLRSEQERFLGEDPGDEAPVFLSPQGEPWTEHTLSNTERYFHSLRERARIPRQDSKGRRVSIHSLRHTFGTVLARAGARPEVVARLMGHSDTKVTLAYYVHVEAEDMRAARALRPEGWSQMGDLNPRPLLYESASSRGVLFSAVVAATLAEPVEVDPVDDCPAPRVVRTAEPTQPAGELVRLVVRARQGSALWWALMEAAREEEEGVERA